MIRPVSMAVRYFFHNKNDFSCKSVIDKTLSMKYINPI